MSGGRGGKPPAGFVPLRSLKEGPADPAATLAEIRQLYFKTTPETIEHDLAHAVALLKGLEDETQREKATVYMHGLSEMRNDWGGGRRKAPGGPARTTRRKVPR